MSAYYPRQARTLDVLVGPVGFKRGCDLCEELVYRPRYYP